MPAAALRAQVHRIDIHARRLADEVMAGHYRSVFRGQGLEFDALREYVEGDDPRAVDWSVTARKGRPFVKTYVDERELPVLFVVDGSASMAGRPGENTPRDVAAHTVALVAFNALRNADKVGLVTFGAGVRSYVPPKKGRSHALRLVRDCLSLPQTGRSADLARASRFAARTLRRRALVVVVSDFLEHDWALALAALSRQHDVVATRLLLPELDNPPRALVRARDPETGRMSWVDGRSARVRRAWDARVAAWRARTDRDLRRAQVDVLDVDLAAPCDLGALAVRWMAFFRSRQRRGGR